MIEAKKKYGQNFLKDQNIINKIVDSVQTTSKDLIIEIGPGQGALTRLLRNKPSQLICFEIDERMHAVLDELENDKTRIIYQDILTTNVEEVIDPDNYENIYVIANLPYYITTPIVEKFIESNIKIKRMILMVQKEVADRFASKPSCKEYGLMTVLINTKYSVTKLFNVGRNCFVPAPNVDSAVVSLELIDNKIETINFVKMKKFLSVCFAHKRKTLKNNLGNELWKQMLPILEKYGYSSNSRPEDIDVNAYIDMCNKLQDKS